MASKFKRYRSINNISESDHYNNLICDVCIRSPKQCHYKNLFHDIDQRHNLLYHDEIALYGFPTIYNNRINGIMGTSKSGKTLLLNILAGKILPKSDKCFTDIDTLNNDYISKLYFDELSVVFKEQRISIKKKDMLVAGYLIQKNISKQTIITCPNYIDDIMDRDITSLSGSELQMLHIWISCKSLGNVYIFDQPFEHLDMYQRLIVANEIKKLQNNMNYIFISDNDLTFMNYLCDNIIILDQNRKNETLILNTRLLNLARSESFSKPKFFVPKLKAFDCMASCNSIFMYKQHKISNILIKRGFVPITESIVAIIGPKESGKTFYLNWLKDKINYEISIKNQLLKCPWYLGTVINILRKHIDSRISSITFNKLVLKPLRIHSLYNKTRNDLSLQEKQLVEIVLCIGKSASIYMLDNPTKFLDYKTRITVSKVLKRYVQKLKKCIFVVDNDMLFCSNISNNTNSICIITSNNDGQIIIHRPEYYKKALYKEFGTLFYDTECAMPMMI